MNKQYCIYRHLKPNGEVFYIGIGNYKRPYSKKGRSLIWKRTVEKYDYEVQILKKDLSLKEACELEKLLISYYGRKNLNKGTLVNLTDGGEGSINRKWSEETRKRMIESRSKRPNWNYGKKLSEEHKQKLSNAKKGKILNDLTRYKMRLSSNLSAILLDPNTGVFYYSIKEYSDLNGISNKTFARHLVNGKTHLIKV